MQISQTVSALTMHSSSTNCSVGNLHTSVNDAGQGQYENMPLLK